jgi:hypothetical protein
MNDPDMTPPVSTHAGLKIRPLGSEVIEQPTSAAAKFEPDTLTGVLGRPEDGDSTIPGFTWNGAFFEVPLGFDVTVTVETPKADPLLTVKKPETVPPVIEQLIDARSTMSGVEEIVQVPSVVGKPDPLTDTTVPTGPKLGLRSNADEILTKVGADTWPRELGKITV